MKNATVVLCLMMVAGPAWAQEAAPGKGSIVPNPDAKVEKVDAPRLPGGKDDCAPTGDKNGANGCTVLKSDRNHYEWPTILDMAQ